MNSANEQTQQPPQYATLEELQSAGLGIGKKTGARIKEKHDDFLANDKDADDPIEHFVKRQHDIFNSILPMVSLQYNTSPNPQNNTPSPSHNTPMQRRVSSQGSPARSNNPTTSPSTNSNSYQPVPGSAAFALLAALHGKHSTL